MDASLCSNSPRHPSGNWRQTKPADTGCFVTNIMRDFILEYPAPSKRFLAAVVTGMDRYQHHAAHIALGAIAELVRGSQMDSATGSAINEIIQAVNLHC